MMNYYDVINNPLVPYQYPEIREILLAGTSCPSYQDRYEILNKFREETRAWLQSGKITCISGLENFPYVYVLSGISQYISDLPKIEKRKIVLHEYEYGGYRKTLKLYNMDHRLESDFKNFDQGRGNELIVLSYPVSLNGNSDKDVERLLSNSSTPIVLDSAFLGTNLFDINFDFNKLYSVETFLFSFSKSFGMPFNRIGIMFSKKEIEEYEMYQSYAYNNLFSAQIVRCIMEKYNIDYFTNKYKWVQEAACEIKRYQTSECLLLGLDPSIEHADNKALITDIFDELIKNDYRKNKY